VKQVPNDPKVNPDPLTLCENGKLELIKIDQQFHSLLGVKLLVEQLANDPKSEVSAPGTG
jgi:hypothetical protein